MPCITISTNESFKKRLDQFSWVNWSAVGREEILKRYLFEKYKKKIPFTKDEQQFCENRDWHPVDELPLKKEFIEKLNQIRKQPTGKKIKPEELDAYFDDL